MRSFFKKILVASLLLLIAAPAGLNLFAQVPFKPRGNTPSQAQLKSEIALLRQTVLKKIGNDTDQIALSFASSENIFRSLRVAYSFKTILDSVNNAFSLFGIPGNVRDAASAKTITENAANSALAAGSLLLVWENMKENRGNLELVFNSGRYLENVNRMLKEAESTQPILGFDVNKFIEGVKYQLEGGLGQEVVVVNRRTAKEPCQIIKPRGEIPVKPVSFRGVNEARHYITGVFQQLERDVDAGAITDGAAASLIRQVKEIKTKFLTSNQGRAEFTLSLPSSAGCRPTQTRVVLGRTAQLNRALTASYDALNRKLKVDEINTIQTAADSMLSAATYYFKDGTATKEIIETAGKVSLATDMGDLVNKRFTRQDVNPAELIGSLPQEMLMSFPAELSDVILTIDTLAGFVRHGLKSPPAEPIAVKVPEIPTMFLLDVSGSMIDNDKIAQAKSAGLSALKEMQENRRRGRDNSSVAISLFGGECSPNSIRQILPYTSNLTQAETVFRTRIPKPDGATPLYTAVDLTVDQMLAYLSARPTLREGRIILLSDGQNTCSEQIRPRGVYSQSLRIIYQQAKFLTIGFDIRPGSREERDLQYLASASNGKYFPARDGQQLSRVFQKAIRVYTPRSVSGATAEFERGVQAMIDRDFEAAINIFIIYVRANPSDPLGYYNLALACEAAERYKQAIENYKKYLQLASGAADSREVEETIVDLEEDQRSETQYYTDLLRSDLDYLKDYYKRLFGLKNAELSAEFAGFVAEKGQFYRNLPQILEIRSSRIERNSQELADSLDFLNRRVGLESFDRDAVSLLTSPISYLEELIERIEAYNAQNVK